MSQKSFFSFNFSIRCKLKSFSSSSFCFELIKGTLGNKPKVYGVTFRFMNCIEQATKEKNLISVNKLKIELKNLEQATKEKNLISVRTKKFF